MTVLIMGLGSKGGGDVVVDDGDGGGAAGDGGDGVDCEHGGKSFELVSCSICLESVTDNGDRSWAKLQCGHQFHLDCIGSAFNIKGAMQCPNCRKIEKGQWLFANGGHSYPEFNVDGLTHDEDLYDLSYAEVSFGVHWCPFGSLARLPSFELGEFSSSSYHELLGQQAIFAEHSASAAHPCPYVAYFGPTIHPSSSNSSVSDSSSFNVHWNGPSVPGEMPTSYAFPVMDLHHHSWEHHSPLFSTSSSQIGSSDQPSNPPISQRSTRSSSDIPRPGSFVRPFVVGHSSGARAGSSVAPSLIPPYPGSNARARDRVQALQAYYQQQQHPSTSPGIQTPIISSSRRSSSRRSHVQAGPAASSTDRVGGFYFIPFGTSGRNFQEAENPLPTRFHTWERDHFLSFSLNQVDREPSWGTFYQSGGGASDPSVRSSSFRQRHGSERT